MQKLLLICLWIYIYLCSQFSEVCLEFLIRISSIQFAPIFISQLQHKSTFEKLVSFYFQIKLNFDLLKSKSVQHCEWPWQVWRTNVSSSRPMKGCHCYHHSKNCQLPLRGCASKAQTFRGSFLLTCSSGQ